MAWTRRTATDYKDCLDQVRLFTQKAFKAGAVTVGGGNIGDGTVLGASASENSVTETWTLSCIASGGNEDAEFSVTGSTSGAQSSAFAGVPYSIDEVSFVISAGDTDFVAATDTFAFNTAVSSPEWAQDRWDTDYDGAGGYELIQHGIGAGANEIYVGYNTQSDDTTYWNLLAAGLTGYIASNDMGDQPGYTAFYDCLANSSFTFECVFTSRHIKIIPTLGGGIQGGSYNGWILPHATPSQWSYPSFVGGSTDDANQVSGGTEDEHTCYWRAYSDEHSGAVYTGSGWEPLNRFNPIATETVVIDFDEWRSGFDGEMLLYDCEPYSPSANNVYGKLEGVKCPSQYTPAEALLTAGDVLFSGDEVYVTYKDVFRTSAGNIIAMELMGDG